MGRHTRYNATTGVWEESIDGAAFAAQVMNHGTDEYSRRSSVAHGMTALVLTDVFGLDALWTAGGGYSLSGFSGGDVPGLIIRGYIGTATPTATTPAVLLRAAKKNGTDAQNLANTETLVGIQKHDGTQVARFLGNGDLEIGSTQVKSGATSNFYAAGTAQVVDINSTVETYLSWSRSGVRKAYLQAHSSVGFAIVQEENLPFLIYTNNTGRFRITAAGHVEPITDNTYNLGTASFRWKEVFSAIGTINTSDRREKKKIRALKYGLKEILKLNPKSYVWKRGGLKSLGLIAQDVLSVIPEAVYKPKSKTEHWGLNYTVFIPIQIRAIQEMHERLLRIERKFDGLQSNVRRNRKTSRRKGSCGRAID